MHQNFLCGIIRPAMLCLLVAGSLALTAHPAFTQQAAAPALSVCQARRTIVTELQRVNTCLTHQSCDLQSPPSGVAFNVGELEFHAETDGYYKKILTPGTYKVNLKTLGEVTIEHQHFLCAGSIIRVDGSDPLYGKSCGSEGGVRAHLSSASILGFLNWDTADKKLLDYDAYQRFANAMNVLRLYARNYDPSRDEAPPCFADKDEQNRIFTKFQPKAAAWRALPAKPPISDDVNKHWLLAEDELKEKHFDAALREYEAALEIDPLWPVGQFNSAMLSGELKNYDDAVWHMRCYLELTPNAPDAQAAHDQMLLWQAKAERQSIAQ